VVISDRRLSTVDNTCDDRPTEVTLFYVQELGKVPQVNRK